MVSGSKIELKIMPSLHLVKLNDGMKKIKNQK